MIIRIATKTLGNLQRRRYASWCNLGLQKSPLVQDALPSLQQLPDVTQALANPLEKQALECLDRAHDIYHHIQPGGLEIQALLALTAEIKVLRGESPLKILERLTPVANDCNYTSLLRLAVAKAHWMQGEFSEASTLCQQVLQYDDNHHKNVTFAARNGYALSQLLQATSVDDLFVVRDPFRRNALHHQQFGVAQLNFGSAQVVYNDLLSMHRSETMPLDPALREWKQGLTWWKKHTKSGSKNSMALLIQSQLNANMAWGLLQLHEIEQASKYAHESLKLLEQQQKQEPSVSLTLPLTLLAQCYHKSGAAVTAEGLLQTATSVRTPRTLSEKLQLRYALRAFAALCQDWEKRSGDAERLTVQADQIELPGLWKQSKDSLVYTSLWFWMPSDLLSI